MAVELRTTGDVTAWIADASRPSSTFIDMDLAPLDAQLGTVSLTNCVFLGCRLSPRLAGQIVTQHGAILDRRTDLVFVQRGGGQTFACTPKARNSAHPRFEPLNSYS